jgi:hypothetical protein
MMTRIPMRRLAPFLVMVTLFAIPVLALLSIQGGVWLSTEERRDWPDPVELKVVALQEDRTVLLEATDGAELRVWIFGLDIYASDSPVREVLFDITASELLVPGSALSCHIRQGFVYPTRTVAICTTLVGDLGEELIASGAADLCQSQMKFLPRALNYSAAQADTHRARLRMETRQSEGCTVRSWATRDDS